MSQATRRDRARYAFDNSLSRGPIALIGWLGLVTVVVVVAVALADWATGIASEDQDLSQLLWINLMRLLDAGTMGGDSGSWLFLASMLGVTLCGIFITSILIGTVTSGIEVKLDSLRKGRSRVVETNHTVILGWSDSIFSIVSELVLANANQRKPRIVVMADRDKVEMEDELRERVGPTGRTRIVCRRGSPVDVTDLEIVSLQSSRSIIILPPEDGDPDSSVIKALLAITNSPTRRTEPYHIVAEIRDPKNLAVARMAGHDEAEFVLGQDLIARLMAQTCRQSGLSVVYTELLDYGGDEIYIAAEPALVGTTFGDALFSYEDSAVMGYVPEGGSPQLNPPMDTVLRHGDRLVVISEDDDTIRLSGLTDLKIDAPAIQMSRLEPPSPERTLILGWNPRAAQIVNELDHYVSAGSALLVVANHGTGESDIVEQCAGLRNTAISFRAGDTTNRDVLDSLDVETFDHLILLCSSELPDPQQADTHTLVTLLHLRDIADRLGRDFSIVSEMLDVRNRKLADVTRADDFIVSDTLISLMLSQVSENKALNAVFTDLFDPEGSEIYLKPAANYVKPGVAVNFYTILEAARRRGEVAIGYRITDSSGNAKQAYGVVVNPAKSAFVTLTDRDRVIVLAED
jgi:voltage-gated potassium channel Kch